MLTHVTQLWTVLRLRQSTIYSSVVWEPDCLVCVCVAIHVCVHCALMQPSMRDRTFTSMADCCAFMESRVVPHKDKPLFSVPTVCYTTTLWTSDYGTRDYGGNTVRPDARCITDAHTHKNISSHINCYLEKAEHAVRACTREEYNSDKVYTW